MLGDVHYLPIRANNLESVPKLIGDAGSPYGVYNYWSWPGHKSPKPANRLYTHRLSLAQFVSE